MNLLPRALRRYHLTMACICHPERVPEHRSVRLIHIPEATQSLAALICARHRFHATKVVCRYDGHEDRFEFIPVWANSDEPIQVEDERTWV